MKRLALVTAVCALVVIGLKVLSKPVSPLPALKIVALTNDKVHQKSIVNEFPVASPDGRYLVFQRTDDIKIEEAKDGTRYYDFTDESNWDIWKMRADGTEWQRLTDAPTLEDQPIWSPDGSTIVYRFFNKGSFDIYLMDADGRNQRPLVDKPSDEKAPAFSRDGKHVVFFSNMDGKKWNLYTVELSTRRLTRQTEDKYEDKHPQFSGDDRAIFFHSNRNSSKRAYNGGRHNSMGIFTLDLVTRKITQLTVSHTDEDNRHPFISPDGRFVTYHRNLLSPQRGDSEVAKRIKRDIFVMTQDGRRSLSLTRDDERQFKHPSWSADGKQIYCLVKDGEMAWNIGAIDVSHALARLE